MRNKLNNIKILDSAISLDVLKMDLGLLPKPNEDWNTIVPVECGHYLANNIEYVFKNGELKLASECSNTDCKKGNCANKNKKQNKCNTCTEASCSKDTILKDLEEYRKSKK